MTKGAFKGQKITIPYNGPAVSLDQESFNLLQETCPTLATKGLNNTKVCCDKEQLLTLKSQLQLASSLVSRCPAANKNFNHMWCQYTCSADQSTFLDYEYSDYATSATYYVSQRYVDTLYNSIKNVAMPGTNGKVLDLMCSVPANKCTAKLFLEFIGLPPNAPYRINFVIGENKTGFVNDDVKMIGCNETFIDESTGKKVKSCSCQDCVESCPLPPKPEPPKKYTYILGIKSFYFIVGVCCFIWIVLFLVMNVVEVFCSSKACEFILPKNVDSLGSSLTSTPPQSEKSTENLYEDLKQPHQSFYVRIGIRAEEMLQSFFRQWGLYCGTYPKTVIGITLLLILTCSFGLMKFTVITSPVDLWGSPESKTRIQKNYFDNHFSPFYRVEQVIFTTKDTTRKPHIYQPSGVIHPTEFSGIVYKDYFKKVSLFPFFIFFL